MVGIEVFFTNAVDPFGIFRVVVIDLIMGRLKHFQSDNFETGLFDAANDFTGETAADAIRLEHDECYLLFGMIHSVRKTLISGSSTEPE